MKQNFSNTEIGKAVVSLTSTLKVNVGVNKCGNITVTNPATCKEEKWTLYHNKLGYLWRRCNLYTGYTYPLHMVNRKNMETRSYTYPGNVYTFSYQCWNMDKHCYFKTIDEAIKYFITYFKNHIKNYKNPYEYLQKS